MINRLVAFPILASFLGGIVALIYNGLGLPIAAGVLYPVLGLRLSPMIAAAAMALSSLSVVLNANRLRSWHPSQ